MTDIDRTWFQAEAASFLLDVCTPRLVDSVGMLKSALIEIASRIWQLLKSWTVADSPKPVTWSQQNGSICPSLPFSAG
jgi:hypothetical protein